MRGLLFALCVGSLTAGGCTSLYSDCVERTDTTIHIPMPADPPMQLKIETCHADADSCRELCTIAMQREGIMEALVTCSVTFEASRTNVTVVYDKYNGGSDCPSSGDDVAVPPTPQPGF